MSQLTRTAAANSVAAPSVPRVPTGARSVASLESGPVEELSPKAGVSYEETEYLFQDYGQQSHAGARKPPPRGVPSLVDSTSETFASFVEMFNGDGQRSTRKVSAFGMTLSQAIRTYELTARVTAGTMQSARGGHYSFHL